jgi:hypothetical protein
MVFKHIWDNQQVKKQVVALEGVESNQGDYFPLVYLPLARFRRWNVKVVGNSAVPV